MIKKNLAVLVGVLLCFSMAFSASAYTDGFFTPAERELPLVVDNADIIPDDVENSLLARCEAIASEHQIEVAIVTTPNLRGVTAQEFADDFYDYNGYGYGESDDGMLVVYKPGETGNRKIHITTHGKCVSEFSDSELDHIISEMIDYLVVEDYDSAFNCYLDMAEELINPGIKFDWLLGFIVAGALVGLVVMSAVISKNTSVISQRNASIYARQGSMTVSNAQDVFAYSRVVTSPKVQNNNSGGSTHRSSSGRSHGGSGASF